MTKREFLSGIGAGLVLAGSRAAFGQAPAVRKSGGAKRTLKTTKLFKVPSGYPNALAASPEGLWVGEQKLSGQQAVSYKMAEPKSLTEAAWLLDWKTGKVLKTVTTSSRNTSGMAVGGGYVWMIANAPPQGVFQVDMNSKQISHRQIPLGPANDGGGSHGGQWEGNKLWISSLRLRGNLRVDPKTWQPEIMIPFYVSDRTRYHDITIDKEGTMWQVVGNDCKRYADYRPALARHDMTTGRVIETAEFMPGSCDPHGLAWHDGRFYGCDAGIHPGWQNNDSPTAGWIFQIDFV